MKMIFQGIQKDGVDSAVFFCELERNRLDYEVNLLTGEIIISGITTRTRPKIVEEIKQFFEVLDIKTQKEDIITKQDTEVSKPVTTCEINERLKILEKALKKYVNTQEAINSCIANIISDVNAMEEPIFKHVEEGEIYVCNFGFGLHTENHGKLHVIVLKRTEKEKYLVAPIKLGDDAKYTSTNKNVFQVSKDVDFTFTNTTLRKKTATIYFNRIQEVSLSRFTMPINEGRFTKRGLLKVYRAWVDMIKACINTFSQEEELEDLISIVARRASKKEDSERLDAVCSILEIPEEYELLRMAFSISIKEGEYTLKKIVNTIHEERHNEESCNKINTQLRKEFVEWFGKMYPDIFAKKPKISLAEILKEILNKMYKK